MQTGLFFTFEGIDFSGKSSQIRLLGDYLAGRGYEVLFIREPGGTRISEQIRDILLDNDNRLMASEAELLLYAAARAQMVAEKALPHLEDGGVVLCDRYFDSTTAYQGYGRGLELDFIHALNRFATRGCNPNLTVLIDIDPALARRRQFKNAELDRMENQKLDFYHRVRAGYLKIAEAQPERFCIIKGSLDIDTIHRQIITHIHSKFQQL